MSEIRRLDLEGIRTLLDWAEAEGWNPGIADAEPFRAADPDGFLGAFAGERMVAGISVVSYDATFGFLGLYICHPDFRGRGYGKAVWNAGMAHLGTRTIGLDGVPAQQDNYRRMGFVTQHETIRMSGQLRRSPPRTCAILPLENPQSIAAFDRNCFPADRQAFRMDWLKPPRQSYLARRHGIVVGYGTIRARRQGQKVGPLFAVDAEAAIDLLAAMEDRMEIDVPVYQTEFLEYLREMGFVSQFQTARMYRGAAPVVDERRIFGITTLELG